ncbi:uncharacterized protein BKA78DRAFT_319704 [Phyllosticta capitalensis]|uniref:uncharacterized protein n=1 Tax=Phyllosticta capitalensis TaxID=121624 RepID=UPI00312D045C
MVKGVRVVRCWEGGWENNSQKGAGNYPSQKQSQPTSITASAAHPTTRAASHRGDPSFRP